MSKSKSLSKNSYFNNQSYLYGSSYKSISYNSIIKGTIYSDAALIGTNGNDVIYGYRGNDKLYGLAGHDKLYGHDGKDVLRGHDGNDKLFGGKHNDTLIGGKGKDTLKGGKGKDKLKGGKHNDKLDGNDGNDKLIAGDGNDKLKGGNGHDKLLAGNGHDTLVGGNGNDILNGHAGHDKLYGGNGNDYLIGGDGNDTLNGNSGNDVLYGGNGIDWLYGSDGDDKLDAGSGDDAVYGGNGNDTLLGGAGNDYMLGDAGNDSLNGGDGNDTMKGGSGNDILRGDGGNDDLHGESGVDTLDGGAGDDKLTYNYLQDRMNVNNDYYDGGEGNDVLLMNIDLDAPPVNFGKALLGFFESEGEEYNFKLLSEKINLTVVNIENIKINGMELVDADDRFLLIKGEEVVAEYIYNTPPETEHHEINTSEADDTDIVVGELNAMDADEDEELIYALTDDAPAGFTLFEDGSYAFDPTVEEYDEIPEGEVQTMTIEYTVTDSVGHEDTNVIVINIEGANNTPTLEDASIDDIDENEMISLNVFDDLDMTNDDDSDAELSIMTDSVTVMWPTHPDATMTPPAVSLDADGNLEFDPGDYLDFLAEGEEAQVVVSFRVMDGELASSTLQNLTINIVGSNDAPEVQLATFNVTEAQVENNVMEFEMVHETTVFDVDNDAVLSLVDVDFKDIDTFGDPVMKVYAWDDEVGEHVLAGVVSVSLDRFGITEDGLALSFDAGDVMELIPEDGYAELEMMYTVEDEEGASNSAEAVITITGENDAPFIDNIEPVEYDEHDPLDEESVPFVSNFVNVDDIDISDDLSFTYDDMVITYSEGDLTALQEFEVERSIFFYEDGEYIVNLYDGVYDFLRIGESITLDIDYTATDGLDDIEGDISIVINGTNDQGIVFDDALAFDATYAPIAQPLNYTVILDGFDIEEDDDGLALLDYNVLSVPEDELGPLDIDFTLNGNELFIDPGSAAFAELAAGMSETYDFEVVAYDLEGLETLPGLISFTVTGINDAPITENDFIVVNENTDLKNGEFNVLDNDVDLDIGDNLTVAQGGGLGISILTISATANDATFLNQLLAINLTNANAFMIQADGNVVLDRSKLTLTDQATLDTMMPGEEVSFIIEYNAVDGSSAATQGLLNLTIAGGFDAPSISMTNGNSLDYFEQQALNVFTGVVIDTGASDNNDIASLSFTLDGIEEAMGEEVLTIDGIAVQLGGETSFVEQYTGATVDMEVAYDYDMETETGIATITLSDNILGSMLETTVQNVLDGLTYQNTSDDPSGETRTVTITEIVDTGASDNTSTPNLVTTLNIKAMNDAPTMTLDQQNVTYNENDAPISPFDNSVIDTIEAMDEMLAFSFTLAGVRDLANEKIVINDTQLSLATATLIGENYTFDMAVTTDATTGVSSVSVIVVGVENGEPRSMLIEEVETLIDGLSYEYLGDDIQAGTRTMSLSSILDDGGTVNGGSDINLLLHDHDNDANTAEVPMFSSTINIVPMNDAPTFTADALESQFAEDQLTNVSLFANSTVSAVEAGQTIIALTLMVEGHILNGSDEILSIDGTEIDLTSTTQVTTTNSYTVDISVLEGQGSLVVIGLGAAGVDAATAQTLINGISYYNYSDAPLGSGRNIQLAAVMDNGGVANGGEDIGFPEDAITATVLFDGVDDAPTLTVTSYADTFTENDAPIQLFSDAVVNTIEPDQEVTQLVLRVAGVQDGNVEFLTLDGVEVALLEGTQEMTVNNEFDIDVSLDGSSPDLLVTISHLGDMNDPEIGGATTSQVADLINTMSYHATGEEPIDGARSFTLVSITDNGDTSDGGVNTTALNLLSTDITVAAVNDAPIVLADAVDTVQEEGADAVALFSNVSIDAVETDQNIVAVSLSVINALDGFDEQLMIEGVAVTLTATDEMGDPNVVVITDENDNDLYMVSVTDDGIQFNVDIISLLAEGMPAETFAQLIEGMAYVNTSEAPSDGVRQFTLNSILDKDAAAASDINLESSLVEVIPVNDAPELDVISHGDPAYNETSGAVNIYSEAMITDAEDHLINQIVIEVRNVADNDEVLGIANEMLNIEGSDVALLQDDPFVTANGVLVSVDLNEDDPMDIHYVVTLDLFGMDAMEAESLINDITYENTSTEPTEGTREISIVSISDNGDTLNGGEDTTEVVGITALVSNNDAPTVNAATSSINENEALSLTMNDFDGIVSDDTDALSELVFTDFTLQSITYPVYTPDPIQDITVEMMNENYVSSDDMSLNADFSEILAFLAGDNPNTTPDDEKDVALLVFNYTVQDSYGATSSNTLEVTVNGVNSGVAVGLNELDANYRAEDFDIANDVEHLRFEEDALDNTDPLAGPLVTGGVYTGILSLSDIDAWSMTDKHYTVSILDLSDATEDYTPPIPPAGFSLAAMDLDATADGYNESLVYTFDSTHAYWNQFNAGQDSGTYEVDFMVTDSYGTQSIHTLSLVVDGDTDVVAVSGSTPYLGEGYDEIFSTSDFGNHAIDAGAGDDTIVHNLSDALYYADVYAGGVGDDTLILDGNGLLADINGIDIADAATLKAVLSSFIGDVLDGDGAATVVNEQNISLDVSGMEEVVLDINYSDANSSIWVLDEQSEQADIDTAVSSFVDNLL